jgi:anti-anti-sigma regulatory factor
MLKITGRYCVGEESISLIVEGRLTGPWVNELDTYWRQLSKSQQRTAVIDLSDVIFIDDAGKTLLRRLWSEGVTLRASGCMTRGIVEEITGKQDRR